jgi:hypothetical protein
LPQSQPQGLVIEQLSNDSSIPRQWHIRKDKGWTQVQGSQ